MLATPTSRSWRWSAIDLVVFDVDGTLYRQRPVRLNMALELLMYGASAGDLKVIRILSAYRNVRERLGDEGVEDFGATLLALTAARCGCSANHVADVVADWIETRPLRFLAKQRYPGLEAVFTGLRRQGKRIGIFSDYPAVEKLSALGLQADFVVSATDTDVGVLKPNPRGLVQVMTAAGVDQKRTLMIGDRIERDGKAAMLAGANALIRSARPISGWETFRDYQSPIFSEVTA